MFNYFDRERTRTAILAVLNALKTSDKQRVLEHVAQHCSEGLQNVSDIQGNTLLHALMHQWVAYMKEDPRLGILKDQVEARQNQARMDICKEAIALILNVYRADGRLRDGSGYPPLYYCVIDQPDSDMTALLLKAGLHPEQQTYLSGSLSILEEAIIHAVGASSPNSAAVTVARTLLMHPLEGNMDGSEIFVAIQGPYATEPLVGSLEKVLALFPPKDQTPLGPLQEGLQDSIQQIILDLRQYRRNSMQEEEAREASAVSARNKIQGLRAVHDFLAPEALPPSRRSSFSQTTAATLDEGLTAAYPNQGHRMKAPKSRVRQIFSAFFDRLRGMPHASVRPAPLAVDPSRERLATWAGLQDDYLRGMEQVRMRPKGRALPGNLVTADRNGVSSRRNSTELRGRWLGP